jgi:hypothetical protein
MDQHKANGIKERDFAGSDQIAFNNSSTGAGFSYTSEQSRSDSEVTRLIKDSIARSNQTINNNISFKTTIRQLAVATSNIINDMPEVASRTVQIANKIVSVGKDSLNTINQVRNNFSVNRRE